MTSLAAAVGAVKQVAGNVLKRRSLLRDLVGQLSVAEIHYLRDQLNSITFQKDILGNLPIELLLWVSKYLSLEDILRLRSVSSTWNSRLTSVDFCLAVIKLHFRPIWEHYYANIRVEHPRILEENINAWLRGAATSRIRRLRGIYRSSDDHPYAARHNPFGGSFNGDNDRAISRHCQYSSGRVAYKVGDDRVVVESLRGHLVPPRTYAAEQRQPLIGWLLSDEYLIALTGSSLLAWRLDSDPERDEVHTIFIPRVARFAACRDRVILVTCLNEVLSWKIGEAIKGLGTPPENGTQSRDCDKQVVAITFHPSNHRIFCVLFDGLRYGSPETPEISAQVFVHEELHSTHVIQNQLPGWRVHETISDCHIYGVYPERSTMLCAIPELGSHLYGTNLPILAIVRWDFYDKSISAQAYHLPNGSDPKLYNPRRFFVYEDQIHTDLFLNAQDSGSGATRTEVFTVDACDGRCEKSLKNVKTNLDRFWDEEFGLRNRLNGAYSCHSVMGDEEFVILFEIDGFLVMRYDKVEPPI